MDFIFQEQMKRELQKTQHEWRRFYSETVQEWRQFHQTEMRKARRNAIAASVLAIVITNAVWVIGLLFFGR